MTYLFVCSDREGSLVDRKPRGGLWAGSATIFLPELGTRNGFADGSGSMPGLPSRISQSLRMNGFLLAPVAGSVCPVARPQLRRHDAESSQRCRKAMLRHNRTAWFTHSPLIFSWTEHATEKVRFRLIGIASFRGYHQQCSRREPLLPYFSCYHSVTRVGAYPAPGGTRRSASLYHPITQRSRAGDPGVAAPLRGLGSSQNKFVNARQRTPHKLLPGPAEKALLGLGSRAPRVASRKSVGLPDVLYQLDC